jgi:hypothetical protein
MAEVLYVQVSEDTGVEVLHPVPAEVTLSGS